MCEVIYELNPVAPYFYKQNEFYEQVCGSCVSIFTGASEQRTYAHNVRL